MVDDEERRKELGAFVRSRREQLVRAAHGLAPVSRGKLVGLRREEVSVLSGVSMTWYTWLEQGRDISPSRQVLDAVAGALRLSDAERTICSRSRASHPRGRPLAVEPAPAHVQRLLDAFEHPAYVLAPDWGLAGWNARL